MRRNPRSVSALWLFLLSSLAGRNGLLSLSLSRRKQRAETAPYSGRTTTPSCLRISDCSLSLIVSPA